MPNGRHSLCNKSIVVYINFKNIYSTLHLQCTDTCIEHGIVIVFQILVGCNISARTWRALVSLDDIATHTECYSYIASTHLFDPLNSITYSVYLIQPHLRTMTLMELVTALIQHLHKEKIRIY